MTWQQQQEEIRQQVSEQPKLEHKQMKISEVFYEAHRRKIKQIKGSYEDEVGGFCAMGLLAHYHTKGLIDVKKDLNGIQDTGSSIEITWITTTMLME